jgi:hypothetical protein
MVDGGFEDEMRDVLSFFKVCAHACLPHEKTGEQQQQQVLSVLHKWVYAWMCIE